MSFLKHIGAYFVMLGQVFKKPERYRVLKRLISRELQDLGVASFGITVFVSLFVGAVIAIQMYNNLKGGVLPIPNNYIGYATKEVLVLEFAPTMISIILAGKVGSYIASSIGTMRVTEQIDALEVMGINSQNYLILPKVIVAVIFNPLLILLSFSLGIFGGWFAGVITANWSSFDYIAGIQKDFSAYAFFYSLVKTTVFAFVIATVPAYFGYHVKGGSLEVGKASTTSVVWCCILIIMLDLLITQMMLA